LDCWCDADFAGLWGYEDDQDPVSVKSRTGFSLTLFNCPIVWSSKLQTDITLSSTAAEYVAFSMAMRELIPMRTLLLEISERMELTVIKESLVLSTVFEDNQSCLSCVNVPKMSTRNKYLALKYHFFRSFIGRDKGIIATYIPTTLQRADILTKGLLESSFLSSESCSWDGKVGNPYPSTMFRRIRFCATSTAHSILTSTGQTISEIIRTNSGIQFSVPLLSYADPAVSVLSAAGRATKS